MHYLEKYDKLSLESREGFMKNIFALFGFVGFACVFCGAYGVSVVGANNASGESDARSGVLVSNTSTNGRADRGKQGLANAYKQTQMANYYITTQVDIGTACAQRIMKCLTEYCDGTTVTAGIVKSRCAYTTETELYNYALLCLQKDYSQLVPQYTVNNKNNRGAVNTPAQLCPPYVQSNVMSFLSMSNMADQLSKTHSSLCIQRRQEVEAAMSCHSVALAYGNDTTSKLTSALTDTCGSGVPGGSAEMVSRFVSAGNIGANVWEWAEKIVGLDVNSKGADWQAAVDNVLVGYVNRMNLACGDNMQVNPSAKTVSTTGSTAVLATAAIIANNVARNEDNNVATGIVAKKVDDGSLWMQVLSNYDLLSYDVAKQVVNAGIATTGMTDNPFLSGSQMVQMQEAYKKGTKVFIISDGTRCYMVPVRTLTEQETSLVSVQFSNCRS